MARFQSAWRTGRNGHRNGAVSQAAFMTISFGQIAGDGMRKIASLEELSQLTGQEIAVSDWVEISQERINLFADATGDHQWIHVDAERCRRDSPYGGTVAHGFLSLSLLPMLLVRLFWFGGVWLVVFFGVFLLLFFLSVLVCCCV